MANIVDFVCFVIALVCFVLEEGGCSAGVRSIHTSEASQRLHAGADGCGYDAVSSGRSSVRFGPGGLVTYKADWDGSWVGADWLGGRTSWSEERCSSLSQLLSACIRVKADDATAIQKVASEIYCMSAGRVSGHSNERRARSRGGISLYFRLATTLNYSDRGLVVEKLNIKARPPLQPKATVCAPAREHNAVGRYSCGTQSTFWPFQVIHFLSALRA